MFHIVNSNYERFQVFGFIEDKLYEALEGLLDASYENGFFFPWLYMIKKVFLLKIFPKFYFLTLIFHPNVDKFRKVSIDILESQWSPNLIIGKIIISTQSLLDAPSPYEFLNESADKSYKENIYEYENMVR